MVITSPAPQSASIPLPDIMRAQATMARKQVKTPLEDLLTSPRKAGEDNPLAAQLVRWARAQRESYLLQLQEWRLNRINYLQEMQDNFSHRKIEHSPDWNPKKHIEQVFQVSNDSMNVVGAICEFAAASAENDLFGAEPWFATAPIGRADPALADQLQKHLRWSFRDGKLVQNYCRVIEHAATLGECFVKSSYHIETDEHDEAAMALHANGKPVVDQSGKYIDTMEAAQAFLATPEGKKRIKGKTLEWKQAFRKVQSVISQGIDQTIIHPNDIAFREAAPELDLRYTNVYCRVEMSVMDAMRKFNLSKEDALRLAQLAKLNPESLKNDKEQTADSPAPITVATEEELGADEAERLLNSRVELIEGFIKADPVGDGKTRRCYIVFVAAAEDWLIHADYLANVSPKAELPVKVHVWERVPHKLYGRGFFAKYATIQQFLDKTWNAIKTRNDYHANPILGWHRNYLKRDDNEEELKLVPGEPVELEDNKTLAQAVEAFALPDLDSRSMELFSTAIQILQLRSGISSASQGDVAGVPEANTATGVRQLMSRAAVILKKPVNNLRRSITCEFAFETKLIYANFDREEAFVFGEGENAELVQITPEQVQNLDLDVRLLLTQQGNADKLKGAEVGTNMHQKWLAIPEAEKPAARPLYLQAIKALEFDSVEEIIREPKVKIEDCNLILPPEQQARLQQLLLLEQQAASPTSPPQAPAP
jgi:hypothetical protein